MIKSPLANLSNVLKIVGESAKSYEATLRKNEAATRAVLIDPVLRALGWDVANPSMVEVETSGQFGTNTVSADYALKANGEVIMVVEAKKLGTNLKPFHHQLVQYGFSFGIEKLFLTDGMRWEHFTNFQPGNLAPTKVLHLEDDLGQVAAYLVQELDAALISPDEEQIDILADQVVQLQQQVTNLRGLVKRVENLEEGVPNTIATISPSNQTVNPHHPEMWKPLRSLSNLAKTKPSNLLLPDGEETPVRSWGQVLAETCRYALDTHPELSVPLPDKAGRSRTLIQKEAYPPKVGSKEITVRGNVFYVCIHYDADHLVAKAIHVLDQLPSTLKKDEIAVTLAQ